MDKSQKAILEINSLNELSEIKSFVRDLSPLVKLITTIIYIMLVISRNKYNLEGTIILIVYPIIIYSLSNIKISTCFYKLRYVLPLILFVGIFNPLLDKQIIETYQISGGIISMITLMLKGIYSLMASFILIATTPIEEICYALRKIKCPAIITSLLLLTYRYVSVLLEEVSIMNTSYKLRAPNQKGLHISVWGSFLGQLILRSMDKANGLYESMLLRGFNNEFYYVENNYSKRNSIYYLLMVIMLFILLGNYNNIIKIIL